MHYINDIRSKKKVFIQPTYEQIQKYLTTHTEIRLLTTVGNENVKFFKGMGFPIELHKLGVQKWKNGFKFFWYSIIFKE